MKTIAKISTLVFLLLIGLSSCKTSEPMSVRVVKSEMARCQDGSYLDGMEGKLKWNYTTGLELKSFIDVGLKYSDNSMIEYAEKWYDAIIDSTGAIQTYKKEKYNVDHICPGRNLFYLYETTGKEKYKKAIELLRSQLEDHPRTSEGGFWHKQIYPSQMWLDGLYMAQPFYAEYTTKYTPESQRDSIYKDIVNHFVVAAKHTYDEKTSLYRHAWDESKEMFWCDKATGQSQHAWGRALGWYCMGIVEVLDWIPEEIEERNELIGILKDIYNVLPKYADTDTGMWYQVLDCPGREGNYVEATCSAMFTYVALKAVRKGYLDESMREYAEKMYQDLLKTFISENSDGTISLTNCCAVAGLGGKNNRSGDYDYYINEKICENDPKGIGPLIWAALEMER